MLLALTVWLTVTAPSPDGRALSLFYECNRCHAGPALEKPARDKDCVGCHAAIEAGTFEAPRDVLAHWQERIVDLIEVPTLSGMERLRRDWVRGFLMRPHDLRPGLSAMMPRMPIDAAQADLLSRWLVPETPVADYDPWFAWPSRGRRVMERKGCMTCHTMDGLTPPIAPSAVAGLDPKALARGLMLAPDLRHTRERFREDKLVDWLLDPPKMKAQTPMPKLDLTRREAEDVAAFLLETRLGPPTVKPIPERLPVLTRRVGFDEVRERVFHKVCWHCHSEADLALGDGGPGNTGGFGFGPKGLNLRDYASMTAGSLGPDGKRRSVFKKLEDGPLAGTPRLLAHMLARQIEEAGGEVPGILGMPLGLPSFPPEDIQLVESWIVQGRPE
jgi:mono/diheme cytochrome c family protein